jgi:transposase
MVAQGGVVESSAIGRWSETLEELHGRIAGRFARSEARERAKRYLWVARAGSSWREMPEEYGNWETAYRRYELWVQQGLWPRILRVLGEESLPGPTTKKPN